MKPAQVSSNSSSRIFSGAPKQVQVLPSVPKQGDVVVFVNLVSTTTINFPIDKSRDLSSIPVSSSLRTAEAESLLQTLHFLQVCLLQVFSVFYKRAFCRSSCHFQVFSVFYKRAFYRSCRFLQAFQSCHAFYRSAFDSCGVLVENTPALPASG